MHHLLAQIYALCLRTRRHLPILKKPTLAVNDPANNRPITVGSICVKLADILITVAHTSCDSQHGFAIGRSSGQATSFISDLIHIANAKNSPVFNCTLNAEKCLDAIGHDGLFLKLIPFLPPLVAEEFWCVDETQRTGGPEFEPRLGRWAGY